MKDWINQKDLLGITLGIILVILTFPSYDLSFEPGIDPPLKWVFTHFYSTGFESGHYLNFPHGPLAFLMYPLKNTLWITVIFTSLIKILVVFLFTRLFSSMCVLRWIQIALSAYVIFVIAGINQLLIVAVFTGYLASFKNKNDRYKLLGFLLTSIAVFIKSYVGILTGIMTVSFILFELYRHRSILISLVDGVILFSLFGAFWLYLFGSFSGLLTYIYGVLQLAQDNSSAAAYYPENNWWVIGIFIAIAIAIPFIQRSKRAVLFGILFVPSFFGAWKHGMAREDIYHLGGLFSFVLIAYILFFLFEKKHRIINASVVILGLYLFTWNLPNAYNYQPNSMQYNWFGIQSFTQFLSKQEPLPKQPGKIIPKEIRSKIGNQTVDVYPWDYSIIAENKLNWKPRPILHSYAAYTHWLDNRDAQHFASKEAPIFIIWEKNKVTNDVNGTDFSSIDSRYLLNDEPQTILTMLTHYSAWYSDNELVILKRRKNPISFSSKTIRSARTQIDTWIEVPKEKNGILRAKLNLEKSITQRGKSFLYKDEQYWIELKLISGEIHRYRFVPKNAKDGLWISPYLFDTKHESFQVKEIRIQASNANLLDDNFSIIWEEFQFDSDVIRSFFNLEKQKLNTSIRLESNIGKVHQSKAEFPIAFVNQLDSLETGRYYAHVQFDFKGTYAESKNVSIAMSINNPDQEFWQEEYFYPQMLNDNDWNSIVTSFDFDITSTHGEIKLYFHNRDGHEIELKNVRYFLRKME